MPLTLHATTELVTIAWLRGFLGDIVATTLPKPTATGLSWATTGFATVTTVGGGADMYVPLRAPVLGVDCWAANPNSQKPPWTKAATVAEAIQHACWNHRTVPSLLTLPDGYPQARVLSAYTAYEPRRIPDDASSYARYSLGVALTWVEVPA